MSNSYFQFKRFTIKQEKTAMKVSTDGCLQGAWTPIHSNVKTVLDIGTGTGLLSLMLAQKNDAIVIDAIELDEAAAAQANENVQASPWKDRMTVLQGDAKHYQYPKQYDLIICNPPFFRDSLLGAKDERNIARHGLALSQEALLEIMDTSLAAGGYVSVLLPYVESELWEQTLKANGWQIFHKCVIHPRADQKPNRVISLCSRGSDRLQQEEHLYIYEAVNVYTERFKRLLQPFYLNL